MLVADVCPYFKTHCDGVCAVDALPEDCTETEIDSACNEHYMPMQTQGIKSD